MSDNITRLDDYRDHVVIKAGHHIHVIPLLFFENVAKGRTSLLQLDDFEEIVPVIVKEWLCELARNND